MAANPADNTKKVLAIALSRRQRARLHDRSPARRGDRPVWAYLPMGEAVPMKTFFARCIRDEAGVTVIEYGLIAALMSVVCIAGMTFVGGQLGALYAAITVAITPAL